MPWPVIEWQPVSRVQFIVWLVFYALLLSYLAAHFAEPTLLDNVHLPVHEAGHLLFSYLGDKPQLWGGTIFQLLVPALLCAGFAWRGQILGTTFCAVGFFHSCLGVATYMSDALARQLPLVAVGGIADESDHDWFRIFTDLGVLPHATQIGAAMRLFGWCGMLVSVAWFCWRYRVGRRNMRMVG